ncbi:MAG: mechanosensitive ion channel family protein [Candidatus Binatia bacterium]|jgi:MscS family membrane protein
MSPSARKRQYEILLAAILLAYAAWTVLPPPCAAQEVNATVAAKPTPPAGPADEFERGTPRSAVNGYLTACRDGAYERAAEYLDLRRLKPQEHARQDSILARHLKVVIDHTLWIDLDSLSDAPEGNAAHGQAAGRERVGTMHTAKGPVDITLERVPREDGVPIWKFSPTTVAKIPTLYAEFGYGPLGEWLPEPLFDITFLEVELWQWIALLLLAVIAIVASWLIAALITRLARPLVRRLRNGFEGKVDQLIIGPVRLAIAVTIFYLGSLLLGLALPVQAFFHGAAKALAIAALTWLALRLIDMGMLKVEDRLVARGQSAAVAMLPLGRRTAKVFLIAIAALAFLQNVGFNVGGILAGLGIGGLAVALAAQETVKNFFGGVALIADQPVRVGDLCRFGDKIGTVEDISLWSTRVRTFDRTVISIPNAQFAAMQLENLTRRDRIWLHTSMGLHYDTTPAQLRKVLAEVEQMLHTHPKVDRQGARALFAGFGGPSLHIEIFAYILTSQFQEYVDIREDIFLRVMDIVSATGSKFAAP